ncbi:MAG: hypothetical protein ACOZB3_12395, partial [Calditrichota bacterium]
MKRILVLILLAWTIAASGARLSADLFPPTAHVGDSLRFTLRAESANGKPVVFTPPADDFELLGIDSSQLAANNEIIFTIAVYDTGTHILADLPVIVGVGAAAETLHTPPVSVTIQSILPDTAQTPLPIKPYREHPFQWRELYAYWWVLAVAAAIVIIWWLARRYRKRGLAAEEERRIPLLPPHDEATRALITLRDNKYPARGMLMEFFSEYSYIMRRYLERRYNFPALEMTTFDLSLKLEESEYPDYLYKRLLPILSEADLVKF